MNGAAQTQASPTYRRLATAASAGSTELDGGNRTSRVDYDEWPTSLQQARVIVERW